jgi:hypothetical protein
MDEVRCGEKDSIQILNVDYRSGDKKKDERNLTLIEIVIKREKGRR